MWHARCSLTSGKYGKNNFCQLTGCHVTNAAQDVGNNLCYKDALLAYVSAHLPGPQCPLLQSCLIGSQSLAYTCAWIIPAQMHDFSFAIAELNEISVSLLQSVWIAALLSRILTAPSYLVLSAEFLRIHSMLSFKFLLKALVSGGSSIDPWAEALVMS